MKFKSSKPQSAWKIALVPKDATNAWFVRMEVGVKQFAKDTGINAFQKGPAKTDAAMQAQVIEDLIAQGVDAICVVPVDPSALEPVLGEALSKGIVVIDHEGATQENCLYDIEAFSNEGLGQTIMQELAKMMGSKGVYTTMVGNVTNASHNEWADAGVAYQKAHYPNMTLLAAEPGRDHGQPRHRLPAGQGAVQEVSRPQGHLRDLLALHPGHRSRHRGARPEGQGLRDVGWPAQRE